MDTPTFASSVHYKDPKYRVAALEGYRWTFAVHVKDVSRSEAEAALGQPIVAKNWP